MMIDEKGKGKGLAVLIALKAKKDKGKDAVTASDNEDLSVEAARELLDAIKDDDQAKFASLLKDFINACVDSEPQDEKDEEDSDY